MARRPPQVGTIGSTIAAGLKMWISCDAIGWRNHADVDLLALRDQLGATTASPTLWRGTAAASAAPGGRSSRCGSARSIVRQEKLVISYG